MKYPHELQRLSDDDLLRRLSEILQLSRRVEAELVAHIGEVDERRLYAREASPSMFAYCTEVLHLSEHEAYLRIAVARASRKHPVLLEMLSDGRLHLSGIGKLVPHLDEANCKTLLARATHKSKREIEEIVADLAPKPDVPPTIRKLPTAPPRPSTPTTPVELGPDRVGTLAPSTPTPAPSEEAAPSPPPSPKPRLEPLGSARYRVQFTASASLREKLERLKALLHHSAPDGDLGTLIEDAVTHRLEQLEARRFAQTRAERKSIAESDTSPGSRYIPAAVRRVVRKRDGAQRTFTDETGRRCGERRRLQFHHDRPFATGGDRTRRTFD